MDDRHYIDIHSHVIPQVDDGSKSLEVSVEMLKMAYKNGVKTVIATPHYYDSKSFDPVLVQQQFELLVKEAKLQIPEMQLYLGNEMYYQCLQEALLEQKKVNTLAQSRYVLIEFSYTVSYKSIYEKTREMILNGFIPIIAHVERYQCMGDFDHVRDLIELGCYMQINASSIGSGLFNRTASYTKKLLESGLVHFVATDAHNTSSRRPELRKAVSTIRKIGGDQLVTQLLHENPMCVINNIYI